MGNASFEPKEEREISISGLILAVLSKWRNILACMLAGFVLLGALQGARLFNKLNDPEYQDEVSRYNSFVQSEYEQNKARIESRIDAVQRELDQMTAYGEESLEMRVNPYEVYSISSAFYVDAGYEILPDYTYQTPDPTYILVKAYAKALTQIKLDELLGYEREGEDQEFDTVSRFLRITVDGDSESRVLNVAAIGNTKEQAETIMAEVDRVLQNTKPLLDAMVCRHEITDLGRSCSVGVDSSFAVLQTDYQTKKQELSKELSDLVKEYKDLEKSDWQKDLEPENSSSVIKEAIKAAIIGALLGGIFCAGYFVIVFLGGQVLEAEDVRACGVDVIGILAEKKAATRLDTKIAQWRGIMLRADEGNAEFLAAMVNRRAKGSEHAVLVGTVGKERISALAEQLQATGEMESGLEIGGDIRSDAKALKLAETADSVFFVEEIDKVRTADVREELRLLSSIGQKCRGAILLAKVGK